MTTSTGISGYNLATNAANAKAKAYILAGFFLINLLTLVTDRLNFV